ncbi:CPBP family intramembrane metalloprotease [Bacillus mycoides]|uniref:Uncharacterized protein n=1 Tax=Bacillus cereus TaxID=1396 RepID=A0A1S9UL11_BACCE|nr:hypothetical protein BW892_17500 [Bacillus cereus]QWG28589.1 CPBP family intramembrane metalloprotease [Bacillus mycoides]QWG34033.1 CPBP family intramembrane metalloprotease [Bacillus mycoides]QWH12527.1 CPBP family intramembrane metalloprotease [Bacillus mycoides]
MGNNQIIRLLYGILSFVGAIIFLRLCEYLFDINLYNEMTDSFIFSFFKYIISQWNIVCFRLFRVLLLVMYTEKNSLLAPIFIHCVWNLTSIR